MGRRRRKLVRLLVAVACLAGVAWVVSSLGPRRVLAAALAADPVWLALSALPVGGRFLIWSFKWSRMLCRQEPVPFWLALRVLIAGTFVNVTTPTAKVAGGFVRAALLHRRRGWNLATAYGWALADQITNVLGHMMLCGFLAVAVGLAGGAGAARPAFVVGGAAVLAVVGLAVGLRGWAWRRLDSSGLPARLARLLPSRFRDTGEDLPRRVFGPLLGEGSAATFLADAVWAAAAFAALALANAMVLRALGVDAPLLLVTAAVVAGYFAGVAVGVWGGIGVTEAALTGLFVQLGVPAEQAAAGVLLHRAIFYAVVLGGGGSALWYEGRPSQRPTPRPAAARRCR